MHTPKELICGLIFALERTDAMLYAQAESAALSMRRIKRLCSPEELALLEEETDKLLKMITRTDSPFQTFYEELIELCERSKKAQVPVEVTSDNTA